MDFSGGIDGKLSAADGRAARQAQHQRRGYPSSTQASDHVFPQDDRFPSAKPEPRDLSLVNRMAYIVHKSKTISSSVLRRTEEGHAVSQLYDREGNRKYLTASERIAFLDAAQTMSPEVRTFCLVLAYTGARISEVLALTPERIDTAAHVIIIESLKKRQRGRFRAVPVPTELLSDLDQVHHLTATLDNAALSKQRIYTWCRTTAWTHVKVCMSLAHITTGPKACPKGLRHSFGVGTIQSGVPINFVKKWLGHARLSTTEIYVDAVGDEERAIAGRFWKTF